MHELLHACMSGYLTLSSIYRSHFNGLRKKKKLYDNIVAKGEIAQNEQFQPFRNVLCAICMLESFNRHISVVVCSFFEFGTVSKCWVRERAN